MWFLINFKLWCWSCACVGIDNWVILATVLPLSYVPVPWRLKQQSCKPLLLSLYPMTGCPIETTKPVVMLKFTALRTWNLASGEWWQYFMGFPCSADVLLCVESNILLWTVPGPRQQRPRWSRDNVPPLSTQVRGFKPGRSRQDFSGQKNPQHAFLRRGSKAVGPVS